MNRVWRILPVALFSAIAALFLIGLYGRPPSTIPSALIGKPAPAFALPAIAELQASDGKPVPGLALADLKGRGVTVVNVFASWCVPCRDEHPQLLALSRSGVRLVGINYKDDPENARRFLGSLGNPYSAVGSDASGRAAVEWGVYGVPESFVVDSEGIIRFKQIGPISPEQLASVVLPQIEAAARQP
jgi:cytochrome c biogenesis protein CcmG/thiol:disulfide interchange protein DsbE